MTDVNSKPNFKNAIYFSKPVLELEWDRVKRMRREGHPRIRGGNYRAFKPYDLKTPDPTFTPWQRQFNKLFAGEQG